MAHELSDFIDSVKELMTDAQYKEGMELCQKLFNQNEKKLYTMTYLRPYTFLDDHCDDDECLESKMMISFTKVSSLIQLTEEHAKRIQESNLFLGSEEEMGAFIDVDVLQSFPSDAAEIGNDFHWYEFPVLSIELVE